MNGSAPRGGGHDNEEATGLTCCVSLSPLRQEQGIGREEEMKGESGREAKSQSLRHLRKFAD